jgi:MEMO1 family protein
MNEGDARGIVRQPAVAGTFYRRDAGGLRREVDALLARHGFRRHDDHPGDAAAPTPAAPAGRSRALAGLVVPHAGLGYSGAVAAAAWALLADDPPDTIVIAGTNHFAAGLAGVGAWNGAAWRTPIGDVLVDADLVGRIAALGLPFAVDREAHRDEHSIEVQLPFIVRACPGTRIAPLLVACRSVGENVAAGARLGRLLAQVREAGARVVIVASSDFAHYPGAETAREVNRTLMPAIVALDPAGLAERESALRRSGIAGLACGMCGLDPVLFTLAALRAMGVERGELVAEATSADAGGDSYRTVGYAPVAFPAPSNDS